jgi:2-polyprenyl-6-methoxyphenol hydroxylase-like FAD-dependent oxidoreductase
MLACELALAGVRSVVIDRLAEPSVEPKANGLLGQVVRVLDHRGLLSRITSADERPEPNSSYFMFGALGIDLSKLGQSPLFTLPLPQRQLVALLERRARDLGVDIRRGHELVGLAVDEELDDPVRAVVTARVVAGGSEIEMQAKWVVGADGAHSTIRELSGIAMPGVYHDRMTVRSAHAEVPAEWTDTATGALNIPGYGRVLPFLPHRTERGGFSFAPLPGLPPLITTTEWDQEPVSHPMSLPELEASAERVLGAPLPLRAPTSPGQHVRRRMHGGNTRIATRFIQNRTLLIGDAAHIFGATGGGPGLNLGLQDAVNLGWKLAAVIAGQAPLALLDTYEAERRRVAERTVVGTQAQAALIAPGSDVTGLRTLFTDLLAQPAVVQTIAHLAAGTDTRYDAGTEPRHPLAGWFCPDFDFTERSAGDQPVLRPAQLTRGGAAVLFDFTDMGSFARHIQSARIDVSHAKLVPGSWSSMHDIRDEPTALLLRPDGYVAWASSQADPDPTELDALARSISSWFGTLS